MMSPNYEQICVSNVPMKAVKCLLDMTEYLKRSQYQVVKKERFLRNKATLEGILLCVLNVHDLLVNGLDATP